jgi:hypothetical protein
VHSSEEHVCDYFKVNNRTPSYTDRILFGSRNNGTNFLELNNYDCNNLVTLGDHRPVFAQFLFTFDTKGYTGAIEGDSHNNLGEVTVSNPLSAAITSSL